jgi:hypothetical protein
MDRLLETYDHTKLNQEDINHLKLKQQLRVSQKEKSSTW